jgi:SAM-dependent methyltransferase
MCADDLQRALERANVVLPDSAEVLDFGCGCGRTLIPLFQRLPGLKLHGTDIDAEAIAWCKARLEGLAFSANEPRPPLSYRDGCFDLVYAISVFTHLDEDLQNAWLAELHRVLRPGGHLLATVHGEAAWGSVPNSLRDSLVEKGFLFVRTGIMKGLLPDWYQAAYHSERYIRANWQRNFRLADYQPRAMMNYHDVVILRKEAC